MPPRYDRRSIRLPGYDYGQLGPYFVTMVTQRRWRLLGSVAGGCVRHSAAGGMVLDTWRALPARFPTIVLDAFVVMPDHVHGILWFDDRSAPRDVVAPVGAALVAARSPGIVPADAAPPRDIDLSRHPSVSRADHRDETGGDPPRRAATRAAPTGAGIRRTTQGDVVGAFKSLTTLTYVRGVRTHGWPRVQGQLWQRDYFERVIRTPAALERVRTYVLANPARWAERFGS